ncbi:hypothetical protein [Microbacterium sp. zg-YB36]|uniref:hypothetical protein n=1 Tax=Microbacterium sp. zg-YB36 TaxID=2969407 RepID=UPI00214C7F4F|nr:hypothetical protein [Microbacterium sp. zg-YB36]MDL5351054.1 hypothetical protein [Microbacterium sp. zg-YB36]
MDWVNAVIAALGVGVTGLVAWASTRTSRARRRAEEAQLALALLKARRESGEREGADGFMEARLTNTARFATAEFTRLMLNDGPGWWSTFGVLTYGVLLLIAAVLAPSSTAVVAFVSIAIVCIGYALVAVWVKRRRSRRLSEAGIHVPSLLELVEGERRDWQRIWTARREARSRRESAGRESDHASGE